MNKTKQKRKIDLKHVLKDIGKKLGGVGGWIAKKIWGAKDYIFAVFVGIFAIFSKGYFAGYKKRSEEQDERVDERIDLLTQLAGEDNDSVDAIDEARDLVDEYGIEVLREAASRVEDDWASEEEST